MCKWLKEKDVIDRMLNQIDFQGMTAEQLAGANGLLKQLISRFCSRVLEAEMRDRNSTFEPVIIPKYAKRSPLFNDRIISMYSFRMSTRDIQRHLQQVYGLARSPEIISNITESIMTDVREWQKRPLEKSYPILFLDSLRVNSRQEGKNVNQQPRRRAFVKTIRPCTFLTRWLQSALIPFVTTRYVR